MLLTQTNWLRMPARELGSSFDAPNGTHGTTLLKRHKILPHPRENRVLDSYPRPRGSKPRDLVIDTGISSMPSSDTSSPRTLKHASRSLLPPTPPAHSRHSSGSHQIAPSAPKPDVTFLKGSSDEPSVPSTPPNQRSPPTPDVTPPRAMPLAFRPPATDPYASSRTDSFKTARENISSSDDDEVSTVRLAETSGVHSQVEVPEIPQRSPKRKPIGLGLGLESDNEGTTTPRPNAESGREEFIVFDGEWGSTGEEASEVEREWDDNLMRNVTVRKRPGRRLHMLTDRAADEVVEDIIVSPTNATRVVRGLPLQERLARYRLEKDALDRTSVEPFLETIPASAAIVYPESPRTPDVRRFSAMSGRSAVSTSIEAMVIDNPPQRRKTLRHSKKQLALRDFSSDQSTLSSAPNSVGSSEQHHRLVQKAPRNSQQQHRSLPSNTTMSTTSSSSKSRQEILNSGGIPVIVIPDRRSSTKSSKTPSLRSTSSRRTKRSMSLNSAPMSQSSKSNEPGYFDISSRQKRRMSESAGSANSELTIDYPPKIPVRRSSLSAPTSRNASRTGSLTSETLKANNLHHTQMLEWKPEPVQSQLPNESPREMGHHARQLSLDDNGDPFFGSRLSTQATPFSQASYASYETAGTSAEVSEAQAVSIFPHKNNSLLLVQQQAPSAVSSPAPSKNPKVALNGVATGGPVTPPQPTHPMDEVDSPLRNPRVPPQPPAIKFIPPTPGVLSPDHEEDRQLGPIMDERPEVSDNKPKTALSVMRRAFSTRRNSDSAALPGVSLLKRTFSLGGRHRTSTDGSSELSNRSDMYPSVADPPADGSKLHPFWRPAHFWDDLEDDEYDSIDEYGRYPIIDNRPAPPKRSLSGKLKRTFAILPIKDDYEYQPYPEDRRKVYRPQSGNMRVVNQRSKQSLRREQSGQGNYGDGEGDGQREPFGYGFNEGNGGKFHTIPGLGIRVEYIGWGGMKRRLSERRREQRSEKLRATISGPREVQSGMDDVLRRRRSQV